MERFKLSVIAVIVAVAAGGIFNASLETEAAWPVDCLPSDTVIWVECFNLGAGDTSVEDDDESQEDVVTEQNGAWDEEGEIPASFCRIGSEELVIRDFECITPEITLGGFANYTVQFLLGYNEPAEGSQFLHVGYSTGGGAFSEIVSLPSPGSQLNTCGLDDGNCATDAKSLTLALGCDTTSLLLSFASLDPDAVTFIDNILVIGSDPCVVPSIEVSNVCATPSGFDAIFDITIGTQTETVPCGGSTTLENPAPGSYPVTETISGSDADGFTTVIVCGNALTPGREANVTIEDEPVSCIVLNTFDPDDDGDEDGDGIPDIIALPVNIEIDNANTNVIGVDNDNTNTNANNNENENENENENTNENNNTNTNTQNQENEQDQDNENTQTNNIDASPEINIDLD